MKGVESLMSNFDENTLVIGPVLEGHEFNLGSNALRGRSCPWNTCALWSLRKLGLIGFPMIGDGLGQVEGGVEV